MTPRSASILRMGLVAGCLLGIGLAFWRARLGAGLGPALGWGLGGIGIGLALAGMAVLGIRLQRRDLPPPPP